MLNRRGKLSTMLSTADVHTLSIPHPITHGSSDDDLTEEGNHDDISDHDDETESDVSYEEEQGSPYINENEGISPFGPFRHPKASASLEPGRTIERASKGQANSYLPTSLSPSKEKQPISVHTTISDDRSQGSEFDRKGRVYLAFKQHAANIESPLEARVREDSQDSRKKTHQQIEDAFPAISAYARREAEQYRQKIKEEEYEQYQQQLQQLQQERQRREKQTFLGQTDPLVDALDLVANALNVQEIPTLTIESLRAYLLDASLKKKAQKPAAPVVQLVHRVCRQTKISKSEHLYLDQPLWLGGATSSREAFAGNLPLRNISSYLSNHPEVCCIIYRDYDVTSLIGKDPPDENLDIIIGPEQVGEFIEPVTTSLTTALARFFDYYKFDTEAVTCSNSAKLIAPYVTIYHARKHDLTSFMETLESKQHTQFQAVLDYILSRYEDDYSLVDELTSKGKITQAYIGYLFKPGDIIVQGNDQEARGYMCKSWLRKDTTDSTVVHRKVPNKDKLKSTFELTTWSWDFDGEFSQKESVMHIEFDANDYSEKNVRDLNIRPLRFVSVATETKLKTRGRWLWKCRERRMISYDDTLQGLRNPSDERYMVDMMMYRDLHKLESSIVKRADVSCLPLEAMKQEDPPDESFIYLAPLTIKSYHLKKKKWVDLQLDGLRDVSWNTRAFESLVLNKKTKRLIQALISNQIEAEKSTDLISGKGNGLIMLLHGGPGTGKTLTAESVAEIARKPLYPVTCGDIGTKPEDVENYLESVLHLGKTWGCVVLLDEADVFLEQRSLEDLHRNALVSVFLRVLEYYDGILILTSNRVGTFDEAFKSRIQLAVHYSSLTIHQRTKIWENFIGRLKELQEEGIDFDDLEDNVPQLASKEMNGREIRNAITTARQYARWERQQDQSFKLNYKVMKEVIETAGEFDEYINTLNGGLTQEQLAKEDGIR